MKYSGTMNSMEIWSMEIVDLYTCMIPKIIYGGYGNIYKLVWSDGDVFQENDLWID
jgi:hypothetical protein